MIPDPVTTAVVAGVGGIFGVWRARVNARRDERIAEIGRAQAERAAEELRDRVRELEAKLIQAQVQIVNLTARLDAAAGAPGADAQNAASAPE